MIFNVASGAGGLPRGVSYGGRSVSDAEVVRTVVGTTRLTLRPRVGTTRLASFL